jgi:uncharacterized membrane protein
MRASRQIELAVAAGVVCASPLLFVGKPWLYPLAAWDLVCAVYLIRIWTTIAGSTPEQTRDRAKPEDPSPAMADVLLLGAAVASFAAVGVVLNQAHGKSSGAQDALTGLAVASLALSWMTVHTIYTLQYARMYYDEHLGGGIDFKQNEIPRYVDFAYLAFTIGMTFQVSDTDLRSSKMRATVLRHALVSFLFVAGILATTVNLIANLG